MSMRSGAVASLALAWRASPAAFAGYVLASVGSGLAPVAAAWLTKLVLDRLATGDGGLVLLAIGLAAAGLAVAVLGELIRYLSAEVSRQVTVLSRDRLYGATDRMTGLANLEDPVFRDRMRLAEQHSQSGPVTILDALIGGLQSILTLAGFTVTLIAISPWMAIVVLVASVPGLYAEWQLSRRRAALMTGLSPTERRQYFYSELMTGLEAAKEIRLLGLGRLLRRRMLSELRTTNAAKRRIDRRDLLVQGVLAALGAVIAGAGLIWAIMAAGAGRISLGDVAVFVAAVGGVQVALSALIARFGMAHNALLMFEHYQAVTEEPAELVVAGEPIAAPELRHGIEFRDVWFRYSDEHAWALQGVDLFVPFGRSTALVGHNGAGKSTMVKLLCRFYDPTRGAILWDGVDLRELDVTELRRRIGAVFQDFMCYELSAAENIALGEVDGTDELRADSRPRVEAAAGRAGIGEVLAELPHGYDTMLSRMFFDQADKDDPATGVLLSGGQWQRVALARAFLRDRRDLLILDEPTSGLDAEAEHEIHTGLAAHRSGRTSVLISHRLGAVRSADHIAVLVDGRIAELGTHATLIAHDGTYARLFELQASGYTTT
ncbi:ABC transporter ATP-binding protein [Kribbella albertanoniae]|uniref:ABC transporter ATP-binding protein n=1 Tax=Kribbella albertanoniae TaxID=1266829 RepID=A0A4R4QBI3_9ACTN|nr:ABC transporter ATP-binding protein [Kribbella albertanoniae]TDC32479.1 ABC transporter ATP-binding protein [Kribbella albertanoniae]